MPFKEFESTVQKLRHAFISVPTGKGMFSACNSIIRKKPAVVWLHSNKPLRVAMEDCRTILRESMAAPTRCRELVTGWPDYVGVKDASGHGVGGIIVGEGSACVPTVFRMRWPEDVSNEINSALNPKGRLTNSDLEMAGLLLLWLVMEEVCPELREKHVALFSDNSPTVHWVRRLAAKQSVVAAQLLRALALRMRAKRASPLTPLHVAGVENAMTDVPSRSFGSEKKWHCKNDAELLTIFNDLFPLPKKASWTVFRPTSAICMRVISVLRMKVSTMEEWRRLPRAGRHVLPSGPAMSGLWEWTLSFRAPRSTRRSDPSRDLRQECEEDTMVRDAKLELQRYQARSRPLARRSRWPAA